MSKILKSADTFVGGVLLIGCMPSFIILIAIVALFRSCMGWDEVGLADYYMVNREMYDRFYITDSTGCGFEVVIFTTNAVSDKRFEEIESRVYLKKSYDSLERSAADYFHHDFINTDIYDFARYAKQFDLEPNDVRIVNIFIYGNKFKDLYRRAHPDYPDGQHIMDSHYELGELYINETDIYSSSFDINRTYRYWGCEATTETDERHTHITRIDRQKVRK